MRWGNKRISSGVIVMILFCFVGMIGCTAMLAELTIGIIEKPTVTYTGEDPKEKKKK